MKALPWALLLAGAGAAPSLPGGEPPALLARPDALDSGGARLRWDAVEGPPSWMSGPRPGLAPGWGPHGLRLEPGERVDLLLPGSSLLRIHASGDRLPGGLEARISDGFGLEAEVPILRSSDPHSFFVHTGSIVPRRVSLERPAASEEPLEMALFISRLEPFPASSLHRTRLDLPGRTARVSSSVLLPGERHTRLEGSGMAFIIDGPARLALVTRFEAQPGEAAPIHGYRVRVIVDGAERLFDFETALDPGSERYVDGVPALLGGPRTAWLELSPGEHRMELRSSAPVLAGLFRAAGKDTLLASLPPEEIVWGELPRGLGSPGNAPFFGRGSSSPSRFEAWSLPSPGAARPDAARSPVPASPADIAALVRDVKRADSALLGAMYCRDLASGIALSSEDRANAIAIHRRHARYRSLVPAEKPVESSQEFCWFAARRLEVPGEERESAVREEHLGEALEGFSPGFFLDMPADRGSALVYRLPERFAPSLLRVVIDTTAGAGSADLSVEMDDGPPVRLRFDPGRAAPREAAAPLRADAALASLRELYPRFAASTFFGPLGAFKTPAPLVDATTAEIPLPPGVRRIRVRGESRSVPPRVALQYLTEEPREPTDAERAAALQAMAGSGPRASPLLAAYAEWSRHGDSPEESEPVRELLSAYAPLFRLLTQAREAFTAARGAPAERGEGALHGAGDAASGAAAADALEARGEWLPALESRARSLGARDPDDRRAARMGVVAALDALGERFLAGAQLRGILLAEKDERLRHDAFEMLLRHHRASDDPGSAIGPLAWAALESRDPEAFRLLAEALAEDGSHEMALAAATGLPPEERPLETILRSASSLRRWSVFDEALDMLPGLEEWRYWQGIRDAAAWDTDSALRNLAAGGPRGRELERALRRGLAIREGLASDDFGRRARSVLNWEEWQAAYPGPRRWVEDPALVLDHAGAAPCRSIARGLLERFHLARELRPLRLEAAGPATLRIEARPVHRGEAPLTGWLEVRETGLLRVVPITSNLPAPGVAVTGLENARAGTKVTADVRIGPGIRHLEVLAPGMDILVRVLVEKPDLETGILPPLSPFTLRQALRASGDDPIAHRGSAGSAVLIRAGGSRDTVPLVPVEALRAPARWSAGGLEPALEARMALRGAGDPSDPRHRQGLIDIARGASDGVRGEEVLLARAWLGEDLDPPSAPAVPLAISEAALLAAERRAELAALDPGPEDADLRRRMALLVRIAETDASGRRRARAAGESIYRRNPRVPGLQALFLRLVRGTDWSPIGSVRDSAGIRRVAVSPSSPEAPELRARRALLGPFASDERLVTGEERLGLSLSSGRPVVLEVEVRLESVEFLPREPLAALYQLDDGDPREVRLSPEAGVRKFDLVVPEGDHAVRIWILEPVANHYLRVRVREASPGAPGAPAGGDGPSAGEAGSPAVEPPWSLTGGKRLYYLSTRERPLRAVIEGPAWIRADELREGYTRTTYMEVPGGMHEVSFAPADGREEALFRIFERVESGPERPPRPVLAKEPPAAVGPPPAALEEPPREVVLDVYDAYPLGGQEDGTLSLEVSGQRVRILDEDDDTPKANQYIQVEGAHRLFHERSSTWFESAALARVHERGGPTLGIREDILHEPRWLPAALRLTATGFLQWPDGGSAEPVGPVETSGTLRGSVSRRFALGLSAYHLPSAGVFGRLLSLDDSSRYRPGDIDSDVFTEYKDDHRHGLVLSETVGWRPWLDSELWARGSVTTNEDMNPIDPDQATGMVGWKQYVEGFQVDIHFRATEFFSDEDRSDRKMRQSMGISVLHDIWAAPEHRLEGGCEIVQDITDGETSGFVFLAWHWSRGRGYRDFRKGAVDFPALRAARIPPAHENRIAEAPR